MKILTSYFYKVRFFAPFHIAFSTALWDPQWFHDFKGPSHIFIDKRGVVNGLRVPPLSPKCDACLHCDKMPLIKGESKNGTCPFLSAYSEQLAALPNEKIINRFITISNEIKEELKFVEEPQIILLVHEAPTNPCSERVALQKWLQGLGIESYEF